jgi:tripartite-type tricarboxylate transporter receptor subunit TctC
MLRRNLLLFAGLLAVVAGLLTAVGLAALRVAQADQWPSRPVTMVVPFAAGGPTDVVGRIVADRLSDVLGQQVIVENVGGAGGMTGAQRVAVANPDGYQVLLGTVGTQAYNQTLYKKPLYNAVDDFTAVALIAEQPLVLVVPKNFPADSLKTFTPYVKANSAKLSFGSGGSGSATHLGCVLLNSAIGANVQHVPYRGSAPAMQDLIAGRINYLCDAVSTALPQIKSGSVKPLAVLARHRSAVLPDVPTAQEQGLAGFEANNWIGLFLPRKTPEPTARGRHQGDECAGAAGAHGGDRHRLGERRSHRFRLSQALRQQRNREVGGADQSKRRVGGVKLPPPHHSFTLFTGVSGVRPARRLAKLSVPVCSHWPVTARSA